MGVRAKSLRAACIACTATLALLAQTITEPVVPLASLRTVPVPEPSNLSEFVRDRAAAIALGKALFWDMQVGSDGIQACASCHFHAGADSRVRNQLSPALSRLDVNWLPLPDTTLLGGAPNRQLSASDFPFHRVADPNDRFSAVLFDSNNIASSQGVVRSRFSAVRPGNSVDSMTLQPDPVFRVGNVTVRQVAARNAPSVINAVFNFRNLWDGEAQNEFNGVNPLGSRDPNARVVRVSNFTLPLRDDGRGDNSVLADVPVRLSDSSLASQAVSPPLSGMETSAAGRLFADIGRKLLPDSRSDDDDRPLRPLGQQLVDPTDSVLGALSRHPDRGLTHASYRPMIEAAFRPEWWASTRVIQLDANGRKTFLPRFDGGTSPRQYSVMQWNFALFFGIAVQMYEATLVSDQTPFDRFMEGDSAALTPQQVQGLAVFNSNIGRCVNCHGGAEFTNASATSVRAKRLFRRSGNLLDNGFFNIGVRPAREDVGLGANDAFGVPLSDARLAKQGRYTGPPPNPPFDPIQDTLLGVDGAFKTPGLRNIELTGPYFHNGGYATLRQVLDFYNRGGDFGPILSRDGEIAPLRTLGLSESDRDAVVAFLRALTDDRVRFRRAPFDHPELFLPNGHLLNQSVVFGDSTGRAFDLPHYLPRVGRTGGPALKPFLEP